MPLTKYVSVTFTGGSNDGSTSNPYITIATALSDINSNKGSDKGPHYIVLSESSAAQTIYRAGYGMPAWNASNGTGWPQELWLGYDYGVILSGAHGQDIIIDPGTDAQVAASPNTAGGFDIRQKSAISIFGSGSGVHNITFRSCGSSNNPNYGAILGNKRPFDIRGVTIIEAQGGGITGLGDYSDTDAWTIVDSCLIQLTGTNGTLAQRGIYFTDDSRNALINNCFIILSGAQDRMPQMAINATAGSVNRATASFCTVVVRLDDANHTESDFGIRVPRVENCIVSMSLISDSNLNLPYISADVATDNIYAGIRDSIVSNGVRRTYDTTSASFHATALAYYNDQALELFNDPDPTHQSLYHDWGPTSSGPALNSGSSLDYFSLTSVDLSGNLRGDPPGIGAWNDIPPVVLTYQGYGDPSTVRHQNTGDFLLTTHKISDEYKKWEGIPQVPFSLATKGIIFRNRTKPYITSTHDPDLHFSSSS